MEWRGELLSLIPEDTLIDTIIELLKRMGFREHERVSNRKEWGIDIMAIRDDPIMGSEKVVILLHRRGLASSRDVNIFAELIDKYKADKGILISPLGFTKDARVLISKEYRGKIVPWDGKKLINLFTNYNVEVPKGIEVSQQKKEEKTTLQEFELDAPLLHDLSVNDLLGKVRSFISSRYPIRPEEVSLVSLSLKLSTAYIFSWSERVNKRRDRALVLSKENMILRTSEDKKLEASIKKALINDRSIIQASEREIDVKVTPSEAVVVLKEALSKELGVPEGEIEITERKKVYVPKSAEMELKIGENRANAFIDLETGSINFKIEPLTREYLEDKARRIVRERVKEEAVEIKLEEKGGRVGVKGHTKRFLFEVNFNKYTGEVLGIDITMSDEALRDLLRDLYPNDEVISIDKGKRIATADVLSRDSIIVVEIDLSSGSHREVRKLLRPEDAFKRVKTIIEKSFPLGNLSLSSYRVIEHKYLELFMESEDGKVVAKVEGTSGDLLDYKVELSREKVMELIKEKYPEFSISSLEEEGSEYLARLESETHVITTKLSKDGKIIREIDRTLKEEYARKIAEEIVKEIDPDASIESITLKDNWIIRFIGKSKVGVIELDKADGKVLNRDVLYTEIALEEMYHEHIRKSFGEKRLKTERLAHYKENGYVHIKVAGEERYYYARIDTRTGKILREDFVPKKGIIGKLRQIQLESIYK
ncbi:predicted type II restriction endonuclease [Pyrococcus sp. NA2]|uniref:restriction endonuclease n=1 Tax=Pyrococcus sp. (strain NA2) TaxID=342949 RepID=UPI000209ADB7|nr:restriction endonuclease [Pyrococcus sp. NA2]AEC50996.1 predicted type II restriction endonuclease [Pyrococcus sp. NA2]